MDLIARDIGIDNENVKKKLCLMIRESCARHGCLGAPLLLVFDAKNSADLSSLADL
jgi:hypothetical protein